MLQSIVVSAMWKVFKMALRTYLPTLRVIARALCAYIRKHEDKIRASLGSENEAALDAVLVACDVLEGVLDALIETGA